MKEMGKILNYHKQTRGWRIITVLAIVAVIGLIYVWLVRAPGDKQFKYVSEPLVKGDLNLTVSASGYVQPVESVDVGTEVSGTIEEVYVDFNDEVKKGELLARLDTTKYQSAYDKAQAALEAADAAMKSAEAQYYEANTAVERNKKLRTLSKGTQPAQSDWDSAWAAYLQAKAQIANAKAQIAQAKHALRSAQYDLDRTKIYSPIDGTILVRNADPGQTVAAMFQPPVLFTIAKDLSKMELQISIDEADIGKIKEGQRATFSVDAYPEKVFTTTIRQVRINSEIIESVVTYKAIMTVDNKEMLLKPGMSVDADITTQTYKDAFIVKRAALLFMPVSPKSRTLFGGGARDERIAVDAKPHVYVLEEGTPKKIYVKVLGYNGPLSAINAKGLQENQEVIINQEKIQ